MGITEDLLNKKREETKRQKEMAFYGEMGITKQLLARKKAGLSAIPSPAESVGASLSEGILGQGSAKRMADTIYQRDMENRKQNEVSPTKALEQLRGYTFSPAPSITLPTAQEMDAYDLRQTLQIADQKKAELDQQIAAQKAVQQKNNAGAAPAYAAISGTQQLRPAQISAPKSAAAGQNVKPVEQTDQEKAFEQASQRIWGLQREKNALSYIQDNAGKTYDDNFIGQFGASYTLGRLTQDESLAWNKYLDNPTEENRAYAEAIGQVISAFQLENQEVLADDATLPWVSQSLANYLPQFADQVKYGAVGAVSGGTVGSVIPVLGTAAGIKAGITAASGVYSYQTMRGAAFKTLLDLGVPEDVARAAANDEAVVSSAIEMADTGIDLLTLGGKELIAALTGGAAKTAAKKGAESAVKKFLKALGKYGLNVAGEWTEEAIQQAVSIANAKRVETGDMNGILELAGDAAKVFGKALWDKEDKNRAEILEAGEQGAIVAGLMGPLQAGFNQLAYTGVTALDNKASADYGQQLRSKGLESVTIEAGLKFDEGSRIRQMAEAMQQKQQNGQEVTDVELGDLYRQIKIGARQEYQNAVQQAQNETAVQQQAESGIMLPTADEMDAMLGEVYEDSSLRQSGMEAGANEQAIESAERISTALGRDIQFFRQEAGERGTVNGFFDPNTGTIYVNSQSQNPVAQIIAHEMTHSVEMADSYQELQSVVMDQLQKDGIDINRRRQEIQELYERNNVELKDQAEIDQEIVAQFVETRLLTDEQTILDLTRTNRSLMERVLDWINRTLQKLGVRKTTERDTLEKARDLYARALQESREQEQNTAAAQQQREVRDAVEYLDPNKNRTDTWLQGLGLQLPSNATTYGSIGSITYQDGEVKIVGVPYEDYANRRNEERYPIADDEKPIESGITLPTAERYSISETYAQDIDTWDAAGRPDGEVFILGETGDVLQGLGAMEQDIYLRSEKVNAILAKHPEMSLEEIKRIPQVLDDPVLIMKSRNRTGMNSRLVMFGTVKAQNRQPVLAVLDLRPIEGRLSIDDMQKVNSAYTRDNAENYIKSGEILYADEKRTIPLLKTLEKMNRRDSSSDRLAHTGSIGLLRSGSMGSITYGSNTVNMQGVPFDQVVDQSSKPDIRYSISDGQERRNAETALEHFGETEKWAETGYLTVDGRRLDFSGRHWGGDGGYREVDHRDISEALGDDYGGEDYSGALIRFMAEGNIRVSPESNGVDLSVRPTEAQEKALRDYFDWANGAVTLDISSTEGTTITSVEYQEGTSADRIIQDIRRYFDSGEKPRVSETQRFRYSVSETYAEEIDQWDENGRPAGEVFVLGSTGDVLQGLGAMEQDIYLRSEKVNTILKQHPEMTLAEIKRIPEILDDPVLVLKSLGAGARTENTRLVLFGTVRAENGQPVLAVLDLRPVENGLDIDDMQKVNSAYTKDSGAANFVRRSEVMYADEKRTTPLLRSIGLTIASRPLLRSGSIGSITYSGKTVNLQGVPFDQVVDQSSKPDIRYSVSDDQQQEADGTITLPTADSESQKPGKAETREAGEDGQAQIQSGITLPTADKVFAQDEETAQNTGSEGKQSEDLDAGEAVRELDDGYWEGLFEEAEQSFQDEEWVENSTPDAEEVLRSLVNKNPDSHAEVYAETGGKSTDVGFLEMVERTSEYRRLAMDQYPKEEIGEGKVQTDVAKKQISLAKRVRDGYRAFLRAMVDSGEAVSRAAKAFQDESLYAYYNAVRAASSAAENMIRNESTNTLGERTGDSLVEILKNVRSKGKEYYRKFQLYMYHMHNVDRMRLENMAEVEQARAEFANIRDNAPELKKFAEYQIERMAKDPNSEFHEEAREYIRARDNMRRAEGHRNKPVFGWEVTAQKSQEVIERLIQQYPEFEQEAKKVYGYLDNLMQYRIDSGLVTEEDAKALKRIYPHYVPVYRDIERNSTDTREMRRVQIGKTIKRATGGNQIIVPLHKAIALQTRSVVREGTKNRFGRRLMWGSDSAIKEKNEIQRLGMEQDLEKQMELLEKRIRESKGFIRNVDVAESDFHQDTFDQLEDVEPKRKNIFTIREGGRRYDLEVDPSIFAAVEAVGGDQETGNNILTATVRKFNNLFKAMVTGYNPVFLARNFLRDIQDAALYSQSSASWAKNYPQALQEIAKNGKYWRQYQALGGVFSSVFDYETGNTREQSKNPVAILVRKIEALNMAIEQAPRLAEFMATVKEAEKSDIGVTMNTLMDALHNANEITTNFGRSGTVGKWLNANLVPFLNPSIQGFDKMIRELGKARSFQGAVKLVAKAALLGIAPAALNQLLCGDEDDWDKIKQRDKDIYYLIPLGGGKWIKIPKGRALSLAGLSANRIAAAARGEKIDFIDTLSTAWSQTAPSNPLENNILQAWMDADLLDPDRPGKTWYGSDIESQRLQSYAPGERYDETTDKISKWIGENTGLSPAKINYLLDQYTGVIGDVVLPLLTPSDTSIPFLAPAISAFTMDTAYSNRISGDFYNTLDELIYAKNEDGASGVQDVIYKFFNKQADAVGEINNAIRQIEADTNLSDAEKRELNRVQYQMRNAIEEQALERVEAYRAAAEKYFEVSDEEEEADRIEEAYREANREVMGAEYALKTYNKGVYERAQTLQKDGVSYDTFYELYFENQDTDLTGYEKTNRTRELIRDLDVDDEQKKVLYMDFISDSDTNQERILSLEKAGATFDDFLNIQNQYNVINATFDKAKRKSIEFAYWLDTEGFTSEQIKAAQEGFKYYSQIPGDGTSYFELRETGMSQEEAHRLAVGIDELEPADGKEKVSDPQKWREIADSNISEDKKLEALKRASNESQARKFQIAWDYGVDLEQYVEAMERLPEFDVDGNGNYNQEEVTAALNGMSDEKNNGLVLPDLSGGLVLPTAGEYGNRDKAVLWQLITNAKSAKNNPFDTEIGEEVLSAMEKYKEEGLILPDLNGSDGGLVLPKLESGLVLPPLG